MAMHAGDGRHLPAGAVTFLFTDIEGSTRLNRRLGDRYAHLRRTHDVLVADAIRAHGGHVVSATGDGFFAAFADPGAALRAAGQVRRALEAAEWPDGVAVRARLGLHTGPAVPRDGDYSALAVHQASRVCSAGHGGQVLATEETVTAAGALDPDVVLLDRGNHGLRDFREPVRLFELADRQRATSFPPLRTETAVAHNLPAPPTSLIGRVHDIDALWAAFAEERARLVTVTGPGGIGKTRLALEFATRALSAFHGGVWFVSLETVSEATHVPGAIATAVGATEGGEASAYDALRRWLSISRQLLVVDNFEHLLDASSLLAALVSACPELSVLVTSQRRLNVRGERVLKLEPLALPAPDEIDARVIARADAVVLFEERASAIARFAVGPDNAITVASICRAVDGVPLAIELAAGRVDEIPLPRLADDLGRRLDVLDDGPRDAPDRHRSLRAVIRWSHELLTPEEQRVFRRLGAFVGPFSPEDAQAVCDLAETDLLWILVERSLVVAEQRDGQPCMWLLESIRKFALEQLDRSGERPAVADRHLERLVAVAEQVRTSRAYDLLTHRAANCRAALDWAFEGSGSADLGRRLAVALHHFWDLNADWAEGIHWLTRADRSTTSESERSIVLAAQAWLLFRRGDRAAARAAAEQTMAIESAPAARASALHLLAVFALADDDDARTIELAGRAMAEYRAIDPEHPEAPWLYVPMAAAYERMRPARARELVALGLAQSDPVRDPDGRSRLLRHLAVHDLADNAYEDAERSLLEAEALLRPRAFALGLALTLDLRSQVCVATGRLDEARALSEEAVSIADRVGSPVAVQQARAGRTWLAVLEGDRATARRLMPRDLPAVVRPGDVVRHLLCAAGISSLEGDARGVILAAESAKVMLAEREHITPRWVVGELQRLHNEACAVLSPKDVDALRGDAECMRIEELTRRILSAVAP